jgi:hypothetical protein
MCQICHLPYQNVRDNISGIEQLKHARRSVISPEEDGWGFSSHWKKCVVESLAIQRGMGCGQRLSRPAKAAPIKKNGRAPKSEE